jgi:hypothetical protein
LTIAKLLEGAITRISSPACKREGFISLSP